jgi:hypothetical protein
MCKISFKEYVGHPVEDDRTVVLSDVVWIRKGSIRKNELYKQLINPLDESPITKKDLELFKDVDVSDACAAYMATSSSQDGIKDCLEMMLKMRAFDKPRYYIVKVWMAPGVEPTAEALRYLRYSIENMGKQGDLVFSFGHDTNLATGESRMLMITYVSMAYNAMDFEYCWYNKLCSCPLETIISEIGGPYESIIRYIGYSSVRSWEETERILDYFKDKDIAFRNVVHKAVEEYIYMSRFVINPEAEAFNLRKIEWGLKNGADVNAHYDGRTPLDLVRRLNKPRIDKPTPDELVYENTRMRECEQLLLKYGAKSIEDIRKTEAQNQDYKVELQRMR